MTFLKDIFLVEINCLKPLIKKCFSFVFIRMYRERFVNGPLLPLLVTLFSFYSRLKSFHYVLLYVRLCVVKDYGFYDSFGVGLLLCIAYRYSCSNGKWKSENKRVNVMILYRKSFNFILDTPTHADSCLRD